MQGGACAWAWLLVLAALLGCGAGGWIARGRFGLLDPGPRGGEVETRVAVTDGSESGGIRLEARRAAQERLRHGGL